MRQETPFGKLSFVSALVGEVAAVPVVLVARYSRLP